MQREFSVEIGFLRAMMGDGGKTRLEAAVLESLPGPDNPGAWSPKASLQAVTAIQGSPLYAFVAPSVQQAVVSCMELLHSITNGLAPRVDSSRASAFVKLVLKIIYLKLHTFFDLFLCFYELIDFLLLRV